jgi:hypothetical protein
MLYVNVWSHGSHLHFWRARAIVRLSDRFPIVRYDVISRRCAAERNGRSFHRVALLITVSSHDIKIQLIVRPQHFCACGKRASARLPQAQKCCGLLMGQHSVTPQWRCDDDTSYFQSFYFVQFPQ